MGLRSIGAWLLLVGFVGFGSADVKPHALCTDGMVLQQKTKVNVWGTAEKGEQVTVKFRDKETTTKAGADGKWSVRLESGEAGGPFPMTITGKNTLQYKNVLVGEVWVCSGQSNMEWTIQASNKDDQNSATGEKANPQLRMFTVAKNPTGTPVDDVKGSWIEAAPETVSAFSAVGYFFGRDLQQSLKVPVGMLNTNWGGTRAEAWTSRPQLEGNADFKEEVKKYSKQLEQVTSDPEALLKDQQAAAKAANRPEPKSLINGTTANYPTTLYNGMIHPLLNYAIKGAIWYQGESNAGAAYRYRTLFPLMIENWRKEWNVGDFPFLFVQLAPFGKSVKEPGESNWAELREAQTMTLKLPNTGMAVITDYGNEYDIHPTPKQPVGERLSRIARARTYGEKIECCGPTFKEMKIDGSKAVLHFTHTAGGLLSHEMEPTLEKESAQGKMHAYRVKPNSTGSKLTGFTVCGEDKKFHDAEAVIEGDKIVVSCEKVSKPIAVRYGWANHPLCNLFNKAGLPASPFRTDEFPGVTVPK